MGELFSQVLKNLVVRGRVLPRMVRFSGDPCSNISHCSGSENVYSWFDPVQVARMLTCLYGKTVFPGVEEHGCQW